MQQPLYGLIGGKLGHSYSKIIHEQIADYTYDLLPLPTEAEARMFMEKRAFTAINVTIPYKQFVIPYCDVVDPKAKAIGAVNTVVNRDGKLYGYNTDYTGFAYLARCHGVKFAGAVVLVLGTGIGGGIILNGKVLMGAHAAAGEVSGLVSDISKMADDDFKLTSVERYSEAPLWAGMASASGLILEYARQKHLPTGSPMPTGEEIFAAYNAGEPEAQKALKIFARRVAVGILSLQHVLDVEKVAIGGGISAAEALLPAIQAELDWLFERCTVMPAVKPELVRCRYGNDANLIGALKLFFEQNPA